MSLRAGKKKNDITIHSFRSAHSTFPYYFFPRSVLIQMYHGVRAAITGIHGAALIHTNAKTYFAGMTFASIKR